MRLANIILVIFKNTLELTLTQLQYSHVLENLCGLHLNNNHT